MRGGFSQLLCLEPDHGKILETLDAPTIQVKNKNCINFEHTSLVVVLGILKVGKVFDTHVHIRCMPIY